MFDWRTKLFAANTGVCEIRLCLHLSRGKSFLVLAEIQKRLLLVDFNSNLSLQRIILETYGYIIDNQPIYDNKSMVSC